MAKIQPKPVEKVYCKCGELMLKIYPWCPFVLPEVVPPCKRCLIKRNKMVGTSTPNGKDWMRNKFYK